MTITLLGGSQFSPGASKNSLHAHQQTPFLPFYRSTFEQLALPFGR